MLPTLSIPSPVAPQRGSEPPSSADNSGGEAFAQALQRARGEPKPAHGNAAPAQQRKSVDDGAHARPTQAPRSDDGARPSDEPQRDDGSCTTANSTDAEAPATDTTARGTDTANDAMAAGVPPTIAFDVARLPPAAVEQGRDATLPVDDQASSPAIDGRSAPGRIGARAAAHDLRGAPEASGRPSLREDPTGGNVGESAAQEFHAALESAASDLGAAPTRALHAPAFEQPMAAD